MPDNITQQQYNVLQTKKNPCDLNF